MQARHSAGNLDAMVKNRTIIVESESDIVMKNFVTALNIESQKKCNQVFIKTVNLYSLSLCDMTDIR